jgi:ABC-2 type transport system ATP-binding protein
LKSKFTSGDETIISDYRIARSKIGLVPQELSTAGVTIILTTHYIEEAEEMADRIGVISKGEIILVEDKATLMNKLGKKQLTLETTLIPSRKQPAQERAASPCPLLKTAFLSSEHKYVRKSIKSELGEWRCTPFEHQDTFSQLV